MRKRWMMALLTVLLVGCGSTTSVVTVVVTVPPSSPTPNAAATATRTSELTQLATALAPTPVPTTGTRSSAVAVASLAPPANASPAVAATSSPSALKVVAQGYGQNDRDVGYALVVENSDTKSAIDFTQFRVSAYDATGKVLRTETSYIAVVYPGQRLGVAGDLYLPQNVRIVNVDFDVSPGRARPYEGASPLSMESALFQGDPLSGALITGVVKSTFPQDLKNVSVSAIAYDDRGVIIGGGQKALDRVPANGQAAEVPVTVVGSPARVEMYPTISI
ncbi:MAG: hypothetical protein ACR2JW_12165 [Thermomicrobiales bacterium]